MIPIEKMLGYNPEENAAMVRNLNAQAEARARRINAENASAVRTGNGGESVDTGGMQITMYEPETDATDRALEWVEIVLLALLVLMAVGLCAWLIVNAPLWIF